METRVTLAQAHFGASERTMQAGPSESGLHVCGLHVCRSYTLTRAALCFNLCASQTLP